MKKQPLLNSMDAFNQMGIVVWTLRHPSYSHKKLSNDPRPLKNSIDINNQSTFLPVEKTNTFEDFNTLRIESLDETLLKGKNKHYLKLVHWKQTSPFSETLYNPLYPSHFSRRKLLIICRHHVNQPANTFANQDVPSPLMMDYLQTIIDLAYQHSINIDIQLAHLTEAGLGKSESMVDYLKSYQANHLFLLGEETIQRLYGEQNIETKKRNISSMRLKINSVILNNKAVDSLKTSVSYHPFDLMNQPQHKPFAYQDIHYLIKNIK
jgi:hypothetical protein